MIYYAWKLSVALPQRFEPNCDRYDIVIHLVTPASFSVALPQRVNPIAVYGWYHYSPSSSNVKRFLFIVANYKYIRKSAPHRVRDGYIYRSKNFQLTHYPPAAVINVSTCRNVRWNGDSVAHGTPIANQRIFLSVQVLVVDTYQARYEQVSFHTENFTR